MAELWAFFFFLRLYRTIKSKRKNKVSFQVLRDAQKKNLSVKRQQKWLESLTKLSQTKLE